MPERLPFTRTLFVDEPAAIGAQWWQESFDERGAFEPARRKFLTKALVVGGVGAVGVVGAYLALRKSGDGGVPSDLVEREAESLALQERHGWNVGTKERLAFEGAFTGESVDRAALARLATDLAPRRAELRPFYVPTLFKSVLSNDATLGASRSLADELLPILTPAMRAAYSQGRALGTLLVEAPPGVAALVDLSGPESVAFAAGLAPLCEPVFLYDNWPHPRGVVASHLTLAAAARLQPLFVSAAAARSEHAPAVFVVDRNRLAPYAAERDRFDNRYVARVPSADALARLWIRSVLYVAPKGTTPIELDDLNEPMLQWRRKGIRIDVALADDFAPRDGRRAPAPVRPDAEPTVDDGVYAYGGSDDTHWSFFVLYDWGEPRGRVYRRAAGVYAGWRYMPSRRATIFARAPGGGVSKVGRVYVTTSSSSGRVYYASARSGSFGRGGSSGG